jgi:hypothetical protein
MTLDHKFKVGEEFNCDGHIITVTQIDEEHDVVGYLIQHPDKPDRLDSRYRDRLIVALSEYGHKL